MTVMIYSTFMRKYYYKDIHTSLLQRTCHVVMFLLFTFGYRQKMFQMEKRMNERKMKSRLFGYMICIIGV